MVARLRDDFLRAWNKPVERRPELISQRVALLRDFVLRAFYHDQTRRAHAADEAFDRAQIDDPIGARRDNQHRRSDDLTRIVGVLEALPQSKRRVNPADRPPADAEIRVAASTPAARA